MRSSAFILLTFLFASAFGFTAEWREIQNKTSGLWLNNRGYFPASLTFYQGEESIILTGGSADKLDCCIDTLLFLHTRSTPIFKQLPDVPCPSTGLRGHTSVTFTNGSDIFLFGGEWVYGVQAHNEMYHFSMATQKWEIYDTAGPKLAYHAAVAWEDDDHQIMIVFGGRPSVDHFGGYSNDLYFFDIKNKTWTQITKSPSIWPKARSSHGLAFYRTEKGIPSLLLYGGNDFNGCMHDPAYTFNLVTRRWTPMDDFPEDIWCLEDMVMTTLPIGVVIASGWGFNMLWNENVWLWDFRGEQSWTQIEVTSDDTPGPFRGMSFAARPGRNEVVTVGGCWQEGMQPWCKMGDGIWDLQIKY